MAAKVAIVSLGCARNLVDSEVMLGSLKNEGYSVCGATDAGADVLIVNTCSFVKRAREESIEAILEAARLKSERKIRYIVVAGCLSQHYGRKLLDGLPEVDALVGTGDIAKIGRVVKRLLKKTAAPSVVSKKPVYLYDENSARFMLTPPHYAYVKVSEGCDNFCSYCVISRLRGRLRSRTTASVLAEARRISLSGRLKEINLIGQDTTLFGRDVYGRSALAPLLRKLAALDTPVEWIRVLYTHPAHYSEDLIRTVRDEPKVCKYLDVPVQHINDAILKKMNRRVTKKDIIGLIERLRGQIRGLALRTSVIVGFPTETERRFRELLEFLKETRFERLGAFVYSREQGSRAASLPAQVSEKEKSRRFDEVMKLQRRISSENNAKLLGSELSVLIDERLGDGRYYGRTAHDAPEVDGGVYVSGKNMKVGEFYTVRVTDTLEYDLVAERKRD
jgi:ribosomal protein S12 methylthiotransferase